jgi:AcrR family transcriptional regulator
MRRDELKQAAIRVFAQRGYHNTKVADIVASAGVAQGTFYLYFQSKQALFGEILDDYLALVTRALARWNIANITTLDQLRDDLRQIGLQLSEVMFTRRDLTRIFFQEALAVDPAFNQQIAGFYEQLIAVITAVNEHCYALGLYRKVDFTVLAHCVLGMIERVVYHYVVQRQLGPEASREIVAEVIDLVLFGAAAK